MSKGRKNKGKPAAKQKPSNPSGVMPSSSDPIVNKMIRANQGGDNVSLRLYIAEALGNSEASIVSKEAALRFKKQITYEPVALSIAAAGVIGWILLFYFYVLGRGI